MKQTNQRRGKYVKIRTEMREVNNTRNFVFSYFLLGTRDWQIKNCNVKGFVCLLALFDLFPLQSFWKSIESCGFCSGENCD